MAYFGEGIFEHREIIFSSTNAEENIKARNKFWSGSHRTHEKC